jgi:hypothetical protein
LKLLLSGDGARAVIAKSPSPPLKPTLSSTPVDGTAAERSLLPTGLDYHSGLQLVPGGTEVVYNAYNSSTSSNFGLYSAPVDDSTAPTQLAAGLVDGLWVNPVTPHVAYSLLVGGLRQLHYRPVDGSSPAVVLNGMATTALPELVFSPDGTHLVFRSDDSTVTQFELYSVPVDGSAPPVKVNGPLVAGGDVTAPASPGKPHFAYTPDGQRIVHVADGRVNNIFELWSAPALGGGPATLLNNPLSSGLQVYPDFHILSNSVGILYRGNPAPGFLPLWKARNDRLGPFRLASGPLTSPFTVESGYSVTRGEDQVVFRSDRGTLGTTELWSAPLGKTSVR